MKKVALICLFSVMAFGCATRSEKLARHGVLIPQEDGIYVATGSHRNSQTAFEIALATAEQCCLKQEKRHIVLDIDNNAEAGLTSEKTADVIDIATNVASAVNGIYSPVNGNTFRGRKNSQVSFKCE